jgi:ABC-type polysaccharide/polyol phosphate export permease
MKAAFEQRRHFRELLWNLTLRELRAKYRKSLLGWTWSLLNPLTVVLTYGFAFGVVLGATAPTGNQSGVQNFAFFLLTGTLPWGFFNMLTSLGMSCLVGNAGLVRKVAFPRSLLVYAQSIFSLTQFSIEIGVLSVVMLIAGVGVVLFIPVTIYMMIMLMIFGTGIALILASLNVYFRDLNYLWQVVIQVYFFLVPIIYSPASMQERLANHPVILNILEWNPMAVYVRGFRHTLYDGEAPSPAKLLTMLAYAVAMFAIGQFVFNKLNRRIAEEL